MARKMSPWHCKTCGKLILRRDHSKEEVLSAIRRHYKRQHPRKFREMIKKAVRTRKRRR
jgi:hypothetical protein